MKLSKLAQIAVISLGILSLASCANMKKHNAGGVDDNGAQASGYGNGSGIDDGLTPEQRLHKRVYYFAFDRSEVRDIDRPAILANADYVMQHPSAKVLVEGHTDPRGSREYNIALGERRANSVAEIMKSRGVNGDQIRVISYGAQRLAVQGHSEEDYQQDRRAVLVYLQQ
jgi:peptidoglycan-associated lipoprotein